MAAMTSAAERAAARGAWPVRRFELGQEPGDDLSSITTPEQRLEMVWALTLEAWALAGWPLPAYERSQAPVRLTSLERAGLKSRV
jgi:hypothetical protein